MDKQENVYVDTSSRSCAIFRKICENILPLLYRGAPDRQLNGRHYR